MASVSRGESVRGMVSESLWSKISQTRQPLKQQAMLEIDSDILLFLESGSTSIGHVRGPSKT
jgi:hypothetical protein